MKHDYKVLDIIPVIGLGTWEMNGRDCINSVVKALDSGYRHIDTAQIYGNEKEVGRAISESGLKREDIFLTTKIATVNLTSARIKQSFSESLERLTTGYVDLLLIHWPTAAMNLEECLSTMFELKENGTVNNVGVSNFDPILFIKSISLGPVITNQVKFTPYHDEFKNMKIAKEHNKIITAYSPLGRGGIAKDIFLERIGSKYGKTASQVSLRWLIQQGNVSVIPKANNEAHQKENLDIFDFELSDEDMSDIRQLSKKHAWQ
ncbi:MAG TPA: aldo/keto reductase [Bacteroidales bacterium]|nr:aldo/keto reductase [Bacteroidales bacterium]